jgi:hypothetical protein
MRNRTYIDLYVNTLKSVLLKYMKNGINIFCNIYPVRQDGAIIELLFGKGFRNKNKYLIELE